MKKPFLIFALLFLGVTVNAQLTQTIRGCIVDKVSKSTLPGASVSILIGEKNIGTISDEKGQFTLTAIPIGRYDLEVSFMGYEPVVLRNIELKSGKEAILNIEMVERIVKVDEILVTATKNGETRNKMAVLSTRQFSVKETEKYAGSWGDPSRMASNFAGVITANDSRNDIIIRGNSPQGLLWRLEGVNIPNPNHFGALGSTGGPVSMLNNNLLANSDFFTGAFPAEYGNALSGVFDLKLRNGNNQKNEFTGQIGFNGFELGAEGPVAKIQGSSYMANYRYSVLSVMDKLGFDVAGGAVPRYQDLNFKVNMPTKKMGTFSVFGIGGNSSIEYTDESGESENTFDFVSNTRTSNGSTMGVIAVTNRFFPDKKSNVFTTLSATYSDVHTLIDSIITPSYSKVYYGEKNQESKLGLTTRYTQKIDAKNTFNIGTSFETYSINYIDSVTGEAYEPPLYDIYVKGLNTDETGLNLWQAFGEWQYRFSELLTFYAGLHYQDFIYNTTSSIDPRLSASYLLNDGAKISLAYGKHSQIQPLYNYFVEDYDSQTGTYTQTNTNLDFSKARHWVVGYDRMFTPNLKFKIEAYYQHLYDIPVSKEDGYFSMVNAGNSFHQERVSNLVNEGIGRNYGTEITIEKYLDKNYYYLLTTSLFDSKYQGSDKIWRNTEFNTNFVVNALGGYEVPLNDRMSIDMNVRTVWSGGKRNQYIDLEESIAQGETVYDHSKDYEKREKDYFKLDLRISFTMNEKRFTQEWALDITNITNHKNVYSRSFNTKTQTIDYVYQQSFYPMFLYRVNF